MAITMALHVHKIIGAFSVILDYRESKEIGGCKEHNIMPSSILTPSVRRSRTQRM